jgi:hypothetical protein
MFSIAAVMSEKLTHFEWLALCHDRLYLYDDHYVYSYCHHNTHAKNC